MQISLLLKTMQYHKRKTLQKWKQNYQSFFRKEKKFFFKKKVGKNCDIKNFKDNTLLLETMQ